MALNNSNHHQSSLLPILNQPLQNPSNNNSESSPKPSSSDNNTDSFHLGLSQLENTERLYFVDPIKSDTTDFSISDDSGRRLFKTFHKRSTRLARQYYQGGNEFKEVQEACQEFFVQDADGATIMSSTPMSSGTKDAEEYDYRNKDAGRDGSGAKDRRFSNNVTLLKIGGDKFGDLYKPTVCQCATDFNNSYNIVTMKYGNLELEPEGVNNCCPSCRSPKEFTIKLNRNDIIGEIKTSWAERPGVLGISFPSDLSIYLKGLLILACLDIYFTEFY